MPNTTTKKVSVVIPVLNEEKLLEDVLERYTKELRELYCFELIVSDGGSKDGSLEIAERFADIVVRNEAPHRQTIAEGRNCGAEVASGDVIVFINADTYPHDIDKFFAIVLDFSNVTGKYRKASALACPVRFAKEFQKLGDILFHGFYNNYVRLLNWCRVGAGRGECQVVRRSVFNDVNGYRISLAAGEDFDLLARIGLRARVRFAPELLVVESPRRFRKFGYFRVIFWWTQNALSVMFRGRSSSDEWEPVR